MNKPNWILSEPVMIMVLTCVGCASKEAAEQPDAAAEAGGTGGSSGNAGASGGLGGSGGSGGSSGVGGGGAGSSGAGSSGAGASGGGEAGTGGSGGAITLGFAIVPKSVSVPPRAEQVFACTLDGENTPCSFEVTEDSGGTITSAGVYTAPEAAGTYHVVATSALDAALEDEATVNVPQSSVADCDSLPDAGTWENVTPPEVLEGFSTREEYGVFAFAVDPVNAGTLYLGTIRQKIWKSTDCGATWTHVNTGRNGSRLDVGMNWTMLVDPAEPEVVYTNTGYGEGNGAFKSTNGGVDWDEIWPPPNNPELTEIVEYNFANTFAMDPSDPKHLLLTFHAPCSAPYAESCIGETRDGGATWRLANGDPEMIGTEGQVVYFLDNAETWLWASQSSGFWRTEDAGETWQRVNETNSEAHPQGSMLYRARNGTFYLAAANGVSRSEDGREWSLIPDTGPLAGGLLSDGTTMYLSTSYYGMFGTDLQPYLTAPEDTGTPWTTFPSPGLTSGGTLGFDRHHRVLYSSNFQAGFWRVVVP